MPPLGKMSYDVQDVHEGAKLDDDDLLEIDVNSRLMTSDVLFNDGVEGLLKMFAMIFPLEDVVDKVSGLNDVDVLDSLTVLDEQGDVEVNLCDLL